MSSRSCRTGSAREWSSSPPTPPSRRCVEALDETDGELGRGQAALRRTLGGLVLDAPQGAVRLDRNRQASEATYLERIEPVAPGAPPRRRLLRRLDGVDQTFDGIFGATTPSPSKIRPDLRARPVPPWAS